MSSSLEGAAWRLTQPDVTPAELAGIAGAYPELRPAVAAHRNVDPQLRAWIAQVTPPVPPPVVGNRGPGTEGFSAPRRGARLPWVVATVAVVVALASVGALVLGRSSGSAVGDERGFASPEDAVTYVVERVAAVDMAGANEAFVVETLVDGFSFQAYVERSRAMMASTWLPVSSDGYRTIDEGLRRGEVAGELRTFVRCLVTPDRDFGDTIVLDDDLTAADLEDEFAPEVLADLSVVRVDQLYRAGSERSEGFEAIAETVGADEVRVVAILYDTASGPVAGGMELLRYGDQWYVWNLASTMGFSFGDLEPTTVEDYEDAIAEMQD